MDQSVYGGSQIVSAAVLSGQLIIGLADGKVIDCGRVQGPQGLRGDRGPIGATGSPGVDGNTILAGKGPPRADLGKDGDFYINNRDWFVFGPKSGGMWGAGQGMLPKDIAPVSPGGTSASTGGGGGGNGGGSIGTIYTSNVILTDPTRSVINTKQGYKVLPDPGTGNTTQRDANQWAFGDAFDQIDQAIPVYIGDLPPDPLPGFIDNYIGRLWFDSSEDDWTLYVYTGPGSEWVPAAPPVSTEGIESNIRLLNEAVQGLQATASSHTLQIADAQSTQYGLVQLAGQTATDVGELQTSQAEQDGKIAALETSQDEQDERLDNLDSATGGNSDRLDEIDEKFEELDRTLAVGKWRFIQEGSFNNPQNGEFTMTTASGGTPVRTWEEVAFASISKVDSAGVVHGIETWADGDRVELYSTMDDGHAVFTIGDYAGLDTQLIFTSLVEYYGAPQHRLEYRIRHFAAGDGIGFDEAEERYVNVTGDEMNGVLTFNQKSENANILKINTADNVQALRLYSDGTDGKNLRAEVHNDKNLKFVGGGKQLFKVYGSGQTYLGGLQAPTGDDQAATKKYVDDAVANSGNTSYLPLSGGTLTGTLTTRSVVVKMKDGNNQKGFQIQGGTSNTPRMWVDKDGTSLYVQGDVYAVCSSGSNVDNHYGGRRLATVNLVEAVEEHPGYKMRWQYTTNSDSSSGRFRIDGNFIYLDKSDYDNKNLLLPMCDEDHGASDAGGMLCIYQMVANKYTPVRVWQIERSRFGYQESSGKRRTVQLEAKGGHKPLDYPLSVNSLYYITFGGLF